MAITVVCPACGGKLHAPSQLLGRMAKCPQCGQTVKVVASPDSPAEPPRSAPPRKPKSSPAAVNRGAADIIIKRSEDSADGIRESEAPSAGSRLPYGLGIPSLALGIVALLFVWLPLVGLLSLPLSVLGLLLGIAGLVSAILHRGRGVGFPIAGSMVSLVALAFGVVWLGLLGTFFRGGDTSANRSAAKDVSAVPGVGANPEQDNSTSVKSATEKEVTWTDASKGPIRHGDVRLQLEAVVVRNVRIKSVLDGETVSPSKNLTIKVMVDNLNSTRKLDFWGWSGSMVNEAGLKELKDLLGGTPSTKGSATEASTTPEGRTASLTDNFENSYQLLSLNLGEEIPGQINKRTPVYPGQRVEDLLVFEPPIDKVQFLRLKLPATAFGGTGSIRLQIPKKMIYR